MTTIGVDVVTTKVSDTEKQNSFGRQGNHLQSYTYQRFQTSKSFWKSCKPSKRLRGFESLALRQKPMEVKRFCRLFLFPECCFSRRRKPSRRPLVDEIFLNLRHVDHRDLQLSFFRQKSFSRDLCLFFYTFTACPKRMLFRLFAACDCISVSTWE